MNRNILSALEGREFPLQKSHIVACTAANVLAARSYKRHGFEAIASKHFAAIACRYRRLLRENNA